MRRIILSGLAGLLIAGPALAAGEHAAAPGSSLGSLLAYAQQNNPELWAARAETEAARQRIASAGALPDPAVRIELRDVGNDASGGNFNLLPARVGSTKYTISQPLPFWGKRDLRREAAEAGAHEAAARLETSWAELAARLKTSYAMYYQTARAERLTREVDALLTQLESLARTRYANGLIPQQDVVRAQVERTAIAGELIGLETEGHHLRARLNALLHRPAHAPLAEPEVLRPMPPPARLDQDSLEERLQARNPQLYAGSAQVTAAEKNRELAYRNRYPDFNVGISPIQQGSRISEWELMLEFNVPLQQDTRRAQEREAEALLSAARARRDATATQVSSELSETLASLAAARRVESLSATQLLPQAEVTFQSALAGYETGKVDFATVLDAQRQIRQARLSRLKAQVDARVRLAEVERLLGVDQ